MSKLKKDPKQNYLKITDRVVGVNDEGCVINIDPLVFSGEMEGNTFSVTYRYSELELEPLSPDESPESWGDYSEDSQWMAMQEHINNIVMEWKIIKIKGNDGEKGDTGAPGAPGAPGTPGTQGQASLVSYAFKRSATQPAKPTGGTFASPKPTTVGWQDSIPAENGQSAWISSRLFTSNGASPQQAEWSVPVKVADTETLDYEFSNFTGTNPGNPTYPLNGATWHNTGTVNDIWMAVRSVKNGVTGDWSVVKIKGEQGEEGQSSFVSIVFKRSPDNSPITTRPTGGTYSNPIPSGWSDGIPLGSGAVYQSMRTFSLDGNYPQDALWSIPALAIDTQYKDYEYSSEEIKPPTPSESPALWHNEPLEEDIWQAVRDNNNGVYGEWTIQRIKGEAGVSGLGYTISSSNPVYSIAVGSDNIASIASEASVSINIYKNGTLMAATNSATPTDNQFHVVLPTALPSGISVSKLSANTLKFNIASGTSITETKNIQIALIVGAELTEMVSVFSVIPVASAEDGLVLALSASSNVVKFDANNNLVTPTEITFTVNQQNYSEVVTWVSEPVGIVSGTGSIKTINTSSFFSGGNSSVKVSISTPNGLLDSTTVLKVRDGLQGASGINGTAGAVPRTFEWVTGAEYQNTAQFLDFIYYRDLGNTGTSTTRGWYNVIKVGGLDTTAVANSGSPDPAKFVKVPFSDQMTFGTVIAEQANLAGFIFRNQVLTSQAKSSQNCGGVLTEYPNLTIDGLQGIIKFLERMLLDRNGITMKDDCGRPRMLFKWENGIPILRFLNEDGSTAWEAGQVGYQSVVIIARDNVFSGLRYKLSSTPLSSVPTSIPPSESNFYFCKDNVTGQYNFDSTTWAADHPATALYLLIRGTDILPNSQTNPIPVSDSGKYFAGDDASSGYVADGWYQGQPYINETIQPAKMTADFYKFVSGVLVQQVNVSQGLSSIKPCV